MTIPRQHSKASNKLTLQPDQVEQSIVVIRGLKVLLDEQLAGFYGVDTRVLVQQVKRNVDRFPADFMFQLTRDEWDALRSQSVISNPPAPRKRGGRRYETLGVTAFCGLLEWES